MGKPLNLWVQGFSVCWVGFCCGVGSPRGVEGVFADEFSGGGVDDADMSVLDEEDVVGSGVGSADADVMESACASMADRRGCVGR